MILALQPVSEKKSDRVSGGLGLCVEQQVKDFLARIQKQQVTTGLYAGVLREVEKPLFESVLQACGGNQVRAAEMLGLNRNTLRKKLVEHGILPKKKHRFPCLVAGGKP